MGNTIRDEVAQFYLSLSFDLSIKKSFDQAKAAQLLEGIDEVERRDFMLKMF